MNKSIYYIGLDVHKESVAISYKNPKSASRSALDTRESQRSQLKTKNGGNPAQRSKSTNI